MKVIDVLNKIANGEEVKFRTKVDNCIYKLTEGANLYDITNKEETRWVIDESWLNEEVEVIEDKKIKYIDVWYDPIKDNKCERLDTDTSIEILNNMCNDLKDKLDEIIDYINKEK